MITDTRSKLYYEAHVTIDPVFDDKRDEAARIAKRHRFKLAELIMRKRAADEEQPHQDDTFMTARSVGYSDIETRVHLVVMALQAAGFVVRRYKIEDTIMDSVQSDELNLLRKSNGQPVSR